MSYSKKMKVNHPVTLDIPDINSEILGYVDRDSYLFYSTVCKSWSSSWSFSSRDSITDPGSSLSQIKECLELGIEEITVPMLCTISRSGDLDLLKKTCTRLPRLINNGIVLDAAAESGNLEMVKWLHVYQGCSVYLDALDISAGKGDIEMYKWLFRNGADRNYITVSRASGKGHLGILKAIWGDECDDGCGPGFCQSEYDNAIEAAACNGYTNVVNWLTEVGVGV